VVTWQATTWARDQETGSPLAKSILMVLADAAGRDGVCTLAVKTICIRSEVMKTAAIKHLKGLEGQGLIERTRRHGLHGQRTSDRIKLLMEIPVTERAAIDSQGPPGELRDAALVRQTSGPGPASEPKFGSEEGNESLRSAKAPKRPRPGTHPLPDGFPDTAAIEAERRFVAERGGDIDIAKAAEAWRAHILKTGKQFPDWHRAFHGWVERASEYRKPVASRSIAPPPPSASDADAVWRQRLLGLEISAYWNVGEWGPKPNSPGCRVPHDLLRQMGVAPVDDDDGVDGAGKERSPDRVVTARSRGSNRD
jgi:hypothetical protein